MENTTGTIVAVVGSASDEVLARLEGIEGVETLSLRDTEPALAARRITASTSPWVVHDADPLEHVAAAWVELFEERATLGTLELEIDQALAHFSRGARMPDYYIVLEPETAPDTCGATGGAALSGTVRRVAYCRRQRRTRPPTSRSAACCARCRPLVRGRSRRAGCPVSPWRSPTGSGCATGSRRPDPHSHPSRANPAPVRRPRPGSSAGSARERGFA